MQGAQGITQLLKGTENTFKEKKSSSLSSPAVLPTKKTRDLLRRV